MKKFFKVFFSVLGIIVLVAIIAWTALDIAKYIVYADYYEGYKPACEIPDIHSGFTPQGITYLPAPDAYLQSGYDGEHLALYYVKGTDHKKLLPICALVGGILLIWADVLCRVIIPGMELPVGILTSMIGAPCFIYLMVRRRYGFGGAKE